MNRMFSRKRAIVLAAATLVLVAALVVPSMVGAARFVHVVGSSSVYPVVVDIKDSSPQWRTDFQIDGGGSGNGRTALQNNLCDIAMSSSPASAAQQLLFDEWIIGIDMLNIIVSTSWYATLDANDNTPNNGIVNVNGAQVKALYESGAGVTSWTWNQLLGTNAPALNVPVIPVARIQGSGTRDQFMALMKPSAITPAQEEITMAAVLSAYGVDRQAGNEDVIDLIGNHDNDYGTARLLGYAGLGFVVSPPGSTLVKPLYLNNKSPAASNFASYDLTRRLYLYTREKEDDADPSYNMRAMDFVEFALSPAGQDQVAANGFIRLSTAGLTNINPPAWWDIVVDANKRMDVADFSYFGANWNTTGRPGWNRADLNNNGRVDVPDFSKLGSIWGKNYQYRGYQP